MKKKNSLAQRTKEYSFVLLVVLVIHIGIEMVTNMTAAQKLPWYGPILGLSVWYLIPFGLLLAIYLYAKIRNK